MYWLKATDPIGCKRTDSINISFKTLPQFSLGNDTSLCQTNLQLNATVAGASSYQWNTGVNTASISVNQSGIYWADVTKDNCVYRDSIGIVLKPYPIVSLGNDTTLCEGNNLLLDAQNIGSAYLWQDNSTTKNYLVSKPGKYFVTVTKDGCSSKDTAVINYDLKPVFNLGADFSICSGQTITLNPKIQNSQPVSYVWQDGSTGQSYNVSSPGIYSLTLTNNCGSKVDSVIALQGACKLYVPTAFTPNGDGLNDVFKASYGENITNFKMQIYNRWGQKIFESDDIKKGWDGKYQQEVLTGVYIWIIKYDTIDLKNQLMKGTVVLIK
jgi:gliding motility-associated-like protein